ncbi:MAG: hypothetical protein QM756_06735 [Polyangiaceae bacterium]
MANTGESTHSTFDERRFPIVIVKLPQRPLVGEAFEEHCRKAFSYFERGQSFAWVFDSRDSASLPADQRRIIAELTDASMAKHPSVRCFVAVVVASAVQRGVVKAITWLTRQPVPTAVVASVGEGVAWAERMLART